LSGRMLSGLAGNCDCGFAVGQARRTHKLVEQLTLTRAGITKSNFPTMKVPKAITQTMDTDEASS